VTALRLELALDQKPVIDYSGNLEPYQGVPLLLEALARVPEAQLLLMGGESSEIETLRERGRELGVAERCRFAGKRPPDELPAFLALSAVVVSPRIAGENTPFKIYTYLAAGRPLVATRIPTHTQLLDDALATLVDPTAEGIAGGIAAALGDPAAAAQRAGRGVALIEREYSAERYAEKVAAAYAHVAAVAGRG
jgi:glycosyltransferase involved in cell wall biosynthesis